MTDEQRTFEVGDMLVCVDRSAHDGVFVITDLKWNGGTLLDVASGKSRWESWNFIEWHFEVLRA